MHALILRRSGLGLLMDKFRQCLTELSARDTIMAGYCSFTFLLSFQMPLKFLKMGSHSRHSRCVLKICLTFLVCSTKTYAVGAYLKCLGDAFLMSTTCFHREIRKTFT